MRIRPFFWFLLAFTCTGILIFAAHYDPHIPAKLQVHVDQQSLVAVGLASLELHLTDPQGIPIERAKVLPGARMTNMDMDAYESSVHILGNGRYRIKLRLDMAGPWEITIQAHAEGFSPLKKTLNVQVR
jgi:hypothetical protein